MANLIRRDPFNEMVSWNRAMNRMFDRFYSDDELGFVIASTSICPWT